MDYAAVRVRVREVMDTAERGLQTWQVTERVAKAAGVQSGGVPGKVLDGQVYRALDELARRELVVRRKPSGRRSVVWCPPALIAAREAEVAAGRARREQDREDRRKMEAEFEAAGLVVGISENNVTFGRDDAERVLRVLQASRG